MGCAGSVRSAGSDPTRGERQTSGERWPSEEQPIVVDRAQRTVRFAGIVPIVATERTMLEVVVCTPDTREHEALVMTAVRPSHIHAALLALGAEPGRPGGPVWNGRTFDMQEPAGPSIGVRFAIDEQTPRWIDAREWFTIDPPSTLDTAWMFTGSQIHADRYAADGDGSIIGLVSFGTEVVGMAPAVTEIDAQRGFDFVAHPQRVPPFGTRVMVELRLLD